MTAQLPDSAGFIPRADAVDTRFPHFTRFPNKNFFFIQIHQVSSHGSSITPCPLLRHLRQSQMERLLRQFSHSRTGQ